MDLQDFESSPNENPEADSYDIVRFDKSLQELKDLRSQLHYAADYCEMAFLKATQKKVVMENTKEYICRAVVTVVDHLGNVSANLESRLSKKSVVSEAELRINSLKQRLLACEKYAHKVALAKVRWSANIPRHHTRYIASLSKLEKSEGELRSTSKHGIEENVPPLSYMDAHELPIDIVLTSDKSVKKLRSDSTSGFEFSTLLPVCDGPSILSKPQTTTFHFQDTDKLGHKERTRKSLQSTEFLLLLRRTKRAM